MKKTLAAALAASAISLLSVGAQAATVDLGTFSQTFLSGSSVTPGSHYTLNGTASITGSVVGLTSFLWFFSSGETQSEINFGYNDYAYFTTSLGTKTLSDSVAVGGLGNTLIETYTFATPYTGTITFGVANVKDNIINSTLHVSTLTTVSAVPEPESYAMLLAGLGVMGFVAKRRKQGSLNG